MKAPHYILALMVALLDLLSKRSIQAYFELEERMEIIPGLFRITHLQNTGVAFGLLDEHESPVKPYALAAVALVAMAYLVYYGRTVQGHSPWLPWILAVVMGGILGNLSERLWQHSVTDFLDLYWGSYHWPTFNLADSAITVGIIALLIDSFRSR